MLRVIQSRERVLGIGYVKWVALRQTLFECAGLVQTRALYSREQDTMAKIARTFLELPQSTAECDKGPEVRFRPGQIMVRYDYESETGVTWVTLRFTSALALKFTPDIATNELMVSAYSKICEIENSSWLRDLKNNALAQGAEMPDSLRHFLLYFDHYGCVEVIAENVALENVPRSK